MDHRDQRPPRAARPGQAGSQSPTPPYPARQSLYSRPQSQYHPPTEAQRGVSFQDTDHTGRHSRTLDPQRQRTSASPYLNSSPADAESGSLIDQSKVLRKKSLVRPDREKIEPGHRQWYYRSHVAQLENEGSGRFGVRPSTTGNYPQPDTLQRGRSILGREEDVQESGLAIFRRGTTLRRKRVQPVPQPALPERESKKNRGCLSDIGPGPKGPWMIYCFLLTCFIPPFVLRSCGILSPEQQRAWREKMGLIGIILLLMAGVGFLTFGFTESVCGTPPKRFHAGQIGNNSVVIHGYDYDFSRFRHPRAGTTFNGQTNPLLEGNWNLAGNDASFLFQRVNRNCLGIITKAANSSITGSGNTLDWYFPCNIYNQYGTTGVNLTGYETRTNCHVNLRPGAALTSLKQGQVYYTWDDVKRRNLAVFESTVLDLNLLQWLNKAQVRYPLIFDTMMKANQTLYRKDITMALLRTKQRALGHCLQDIITVGFIDTNSIGCVASQVVLYLSLVFIVGVVAIRFVMAVMFQWFFSWKLGNFPHETYEQRMQRSTEIENWTNDIYRPAPSQYRPNVSKNGLRPGREKRKTFLPSHSRFTPSDNVPKGGNQRSSTTYGMLSSEMKRNTMYPSSGKGGKDFYRQSRSTMSFADASRVFIDSPCPFPLHNVVPQPPPDYEPFNFPLAHTICLVTAYSESVEGLRTTLDSLCTTDYPNSHKVILIISDGMVKGDGNTLTTPEICLSMMKDFVIPPQEVEPHSYVAIADGHKRHNMARVFAGFYDYDDATTERSKQQRVPIVLVAKCGNPLETTDPKPGNRGKRDSQIILMSFLQKVMFDERMTTFEYEFFNSLWRVTGVSPDRYELVLCVDADTKVFPDSLTRMVSAMVHDEEIMGLCGETKIANKAETFVTMMQVFEYYISHHMTKAFESMFGGVTCLPGCFSMYRIKAPKGESGFWVPILANPDIVEHYSENVVDTLHKKNLLLLGEDRYLTTLMLKTFPKRKNMFCPQAVCKTVVPDTFRVLVSQRRRWINSTIHNLAELLFVRDLCGTFCFSMQFVVGMELAGTLVLPAAICFTLYLIIRSSIPGHTSTVIPLILLGFVLGLPGLLIVVTSRKIEYVGWMLIYLISLPIWNGILPAYAFWHFDDFSWGQTRRVAGDKSGNEGDKEGEFDSSHIVMKRWAEFERDRRWKNGTHSRDSTFYEKRADSNRYSMVSNSDITPNAATWESSTLNSTNPGGLQRPRYDSNAVLMLPAPLAASPQPGIRNNMSSTTTIGASRSSGEDAYMAEGGSASHTNLISTPPSGEQYSDSHDSSTTLSPTSSSPRASGANFANIRNPTGYYSPEAHYRHSISGPISPDENVMFPSSTELEESFVNPGTFGTRGAARGVRLTDSGPVPGPEGVRRVSRPSSRRPTSQLTPQNRYSRPDSMYTLPPGAAAPQPGFPPSPNN